MSDYIEQQRKQNQLRAEAARKALDALWRTMDQHSILSFSFEYSGSGDCGDIDRMLMNYKDSAGEATSYEFRSYGTDPKHDLPSQFTDVLALSISEAWNRKPSSEVAEYSVRLVSVPLVEAATDIANALLYSKFAGWEDNEGASGDIVFDLKSREVSIGHTSYYIESEHTLVTIP